MKKFLLVSLTTMLFAVTAWGATWDASSFSDIDGHLWENADFNSGDVIRLTSNVSLGNFDVIWTGKSFTLNLNGHTLTTKGSSACIQLDQPEANLSVTIKNGTIQNSGDYSLILNAACSFVLEDVNIPAGAKAAIKAITAKSLTIQGTNTIPSIELSSALSLINETTLTTSIIATSYNLNLTNNGTFTFGANTLYSRNAAPTITNNGTIAIEAGAAFSDGAWGSVSSYKDDAHVAEKWAMSSTVLGKKIFASTPTHVAKIGSEEYASFDAAFLDARLSGESKTIQLLSDANLLNYFSFGNYNVDITVDLNNHTLAMGDNYIYQSPTSGTPSQKLAFENGTITSNATKIFNLSPSKACIPELSLNNVTLTNTYNQSNAMISKRGIGIETTGKAKIALLGSTTGTVRLTSLYNLSSFDLNNEAQCHVYVFGLTNENTVFAHYIDDNTLLDKFGATNAWWEIQQGFILPDVIADYTSHITGTVAETTTEVGKDSKVPHYKITESGATVIATVNGVNYYDFFTALDASSETYPAILQTNVYVSGLSALTGQTRYVNLNGHTIEQAGLMLEMNKIENGKLHFLGNGTVTTTAPFYIFGSSNASAVDYSVLEIAAGVTVTYDASFENYAIWVAQNASNKAYGVRVDLAGTVNSNVGGAYINGNIKTASEHAPIINITGTLNAAHSGIYAAGYGIWNISGTVNGNDATGIGIKAGKLNITDDAVVYGGATQEFTRTDAFGNGMDISGATLQIESNGSYGGNMEISISGNATLSSANKTYAIYEYVDKYDAPTKVNSIAVTGGNFQGGILISQALAAKGGFVSGGSWSEDVIANCATGFATTSTSDETYPYGVVSADDIQKEPTAAAVLISSDATASETSQAIADDDAASQAVKTSSENIVVISQNTNVAKAGDNDVVEVKKVTVESGNTLTVTEGATLNVGSGAVLLDEDATVPALVVEPGAALVVEGLVYGATETNFVIESEAGKSGVVLFSPETEFIKEDHPTATYRLTSRSFKDGGKWVYQRFGMPSHDGTVTVKYADAGKESSVDSYICTWDYELNNWGAWSAKMPAAGLSYSGVNKAVPFLCYQLASTNPKAEPVTYEIVSELMGNSNAPLNFKLGWNPYANSYTAPIDIKEFLTDVIGDADDIHATIYLYKDLGNDTYTWQGINLGNVGTSYRVRENGALVKKFYESTILPMQAFIMKLGSGDDASTDIDYLNNIYNPAMGIPRATSAPARAEAAINRVQIGIFNDMYWDNISLIEGEQFSAAFDNGYDATKYSSNADLKLYVHNGEEYMERFATDNINGTFIGFHAPAAGTYTIDFSGVENFDYSLIDMNTNAIINIVEDGEYTFTAVEGENNYRFQVVASRKVPTAIEDVQASAGIKGVYSITGMYLGENLDNLSKGVYIINGAKVIK